MPHRLVHRLVRTVSGNTNPASTLGAKLSILHDYLDDKCELILKNTVDALADDSLILIDDMVLPNLGVHWQAAQLDILMMTTLASREWTEEQWYSLLEGAGLKINKISTYTGSLKDSIIEVVPASRPRTRRPGGPSFSTPVSAYNGIDRNDWLPCNLNFQLVSLDRSHVGCPNGAEGCRGTADMIDILRDSNPTDLHDLSRNFYHIIKTGLA
ncbi:hypothetical protein VTN77DRAFT_3152 [Rasamsonia byssochlamydoides]|uniref:uncharacterized protein n=1 Tax=Rasamsonia byssochlamydoides TaxID=89139 RepID=UPI0037431B60